MELKRSSGILLHITSLPSAYGIGDFGPAAYYFVDFLKASGHSVWQLLPLNPTEAKYNHSPYSSFSAFGGNSLLISPELLEKEGFVDLNDFLVPKGIKAEKVEFEVVQNYKEKLLHAAFLNFKQAEKNISKFKKFCKQHAHWLEDFSLYRALKEKFNEKPWFEWPEKIRDRNVQALRKEKTALSEEMEKEKFIQFLFFSQWGKLIKYAHENEVQLFGDIPFYMNHDSADCWANPAYFKLDEKKQPIKVSGVPPDYFSETGQLWGTPVYNWKALKEHNFHLWVERIRQNLFLFDLVRLDHFRAFSAAWEVPAGEETAINGKWAKSPGTDFFRIIKKEFPEMPFIAEDLGSLDQPVYKLLEKFNFPGMNVLQFAFGEERAENPYLPFNHKPNSIVYTGTHDNNTTRGWFANTEKVAKIHLREYTGQHVKTDNVHQILHTMALNSVAKIAIFPLQDVIGLGEEAVMNIPGSTEGNWTWRVTKKQLPWNKIKELREKNILFGRWVSPAKN